jgi:predicted nucleic acid-binding protein
MTAPLVDTDVIVRLIAGDDTTKQAAATALFQRVFASSVSPSELERSTYPTPRTV